jgi:hypothetical protein
MTRIFDPDKLKIDCEKCDVLCCVAFRLPYDDYPKPAHTPCKHLNATQTLCTIHGELSRRNYRSCTSFDCKGAGVAVSAVFRGMGRTWISDPATNIARAEFAVFVYAYYTILRHLDPNAAFDFGLSDGPPDDLKPFIDTALDLLSIDPPDLTNLT